MDPAEKERETSSGSTPPVSSEGLVKGLSLFDATTLVIGSMIGSGIFIVSADMAAKVPSPFWLLVAWILTALLTVAGALAYGELAAAMPHAGGQYVFLREAYGPLLGFLYGWTLFLVIQSGTIAAVAVAFAKFLSAFVPWVSMEPQWTLYTWDSTWRVAFSSGQLIAIAVILFLGTVNCFGIRWGARIQNFFTIAKTLGVVGLVVLALSFSGGDWSHLRSAATPSPTDVPWYSFSFFFLFCGALVGSLFASDAWNNVTFAASEVKNPGRNLPLALAVGTLLVSLLYILANLGYLHVMSLQAITAFNEQQKPQTLTLGVQVINLVAGENGGKILLLAILCSTFGCINGLSLAGARVYYAMAKDRIFFRKLGDVHPRYHTPAKALMAQSVVASLLTISGKYNELLDLVMFAVMLFYVLTVIGLFILRRKKPEMQRPYRALGYPVLPGLYVLAASIISLAMLKQNPYALPGLLLTLAGIPFFYLWRRKH